MNARDKILGRLRAAPAQAVAEPDVAGWYAARRADEENAPRISRLRAALQAAHAEVHDSSDADWPDLLLRIAAEKGVRSLLYGAGSEHGARLEQRDDGALRLLPYRQPIEQWDDSLFDGVDAGLSRARSAIADTGCLAIWSDPTEPRLLSLVPPLHFVLLDSRAIHADLQQAMSAERWAERMPTNALLISGPSKTADIQQTLAYGAHGPREVIVLLLHPPGERA